MPVCYCALRIHCKTAFRRNARWLLRPTIHCNTAFRRNARWLLRPTIHFNPAFRRNARWLLRPTIHCNTAFRRNVRWLLRPTILDLFVFGFLRAIHQLNISHGGLVAGTESTFQDSQVTAGAFLIAWAKVCK